MTRPCQFNTGKTLSPWKNLKCDLLSIHGSNKLPLTHEIQQYRCLTVPTGDPINCMVENPGRDLSQINSIGTQPTCNSSDQQRLLKDFSTACNFIDLKKTNFSPHVVDKVIFIHEFAAVPSLI
jgi:hypothetical protein